MPVSAAMTPSSKGETVICVTFCSPHFAGRASIEAQMMPSRTHLCRNWNKFDPGQRLITCVPLRLSPLVVCCRCRVARELTCRVHDTEIEGRYQNEVCLGTAFGVTIETDELRKFTSSGRNPLDDNLWRDRSPRRASPRPHLGSRTEPSSDRYLGSSVFEPTATSSHLPVGRQRAKSTRLRAINQSFGSMFELIYRCAALPALMPVNQSPTTKRCNASREMPGDARFVSAGGIARLDANQ